METTVIKDTDALRRSCIFASLREDELNRLAEVARVRTYQRAQIVAHPGERADACFLVARGGIRAYRLSPKGHEVTLECVGAGDIYCLALVGRVTAWDNFVEATSDGTVVYHIPLKAVEKLCLTSPSRALAAIQVLSHRLEEARDRIEDLALYDVKARLAHALGRLAAERSEQVIAATHRELAWLIGARPEAVTRALAELTREGLVGNRSDPARIHVLDFQGLMSYGGRPS